MTEERTPSKSDTVHICYLADHNVADQLFISIHSVIYNSSYEFEYQINIVDAGLNQTDIRKIESYVESIENTKVCFIKVDTNITSGIPDPNNVGRATYLKLLVPEVINKSIDKIVLIDTDTIVMTDLNYLYQNNIEDKVLCGVQEFSSPKIEHTYEQTKLTDVVDLNPSREYYNGGVILINTIQWRSKDISSKSIQLLREYHQYLSVDDQDAVNGTVINKWGTLSPRWNAQTHCISVKDKNIRFDDIIGCPTYEDIFSNPHIIHFNNHPKPAHLSYSGPFLDLYTAFEESSGYYTRSAFRLRCLMRPIARTTRAVRLLLKSMASTIVNTSRPYRHAVAHWFPTQLQRFLKHDVK